MGFCLLNATAVAARWAQLARGARRVAILDWDVHHGNGTEAIFRDDSTVLTISLHQDRLYPYDTGDVDAPGEAIVNVPLPVGTGDAGYALAFERVVEPAIRVVRARPAADRRRARTRRRATRSGACRSPSPASASGPTARSRSPTSAAAGASSRSSRAATRCATCRPPTWRSSKALAGLPSSFPEDPVGCDIPRGLRDVEIAAVEAAA